MSSCTFREKCKNADVLNAEHKGRLKSKQLCTLALALAGSADVPGSAVIHWQSNRFRDAWGEAKPGVDATGEPNGKLKKRFKILSKEPEQLSESLGQVVFR